MITKKNILDAVNLCLMALFPNCVYYRENCPEDFERPSFYIEVADGNRESVNFCTSKVFQAVTISYASELDDYGNFQTDAVLSVVNAIEDAFSIGYLRVVDRALRIVSVKSKTNADMTIMTLQLEFFDDKTQVVEDLPPIENIEMEVF